MRPRHRAIGVSTLVLVGLSAGLAGCSSGGSQDSLSTSSLRPAEGVYRDPPRRYPDGSTSGGYTYGRPYAEAPRRYVDPGQPTPREIADASYDSGHRAYGPPPRQIETASIGPNRRAYDPDARWQQPASPLTTGSTGPSPTGHYRPTTANAPQMIEVREGDTLYGISRRYNVPVGDLVAANRLTDARIAIGQRLVIPTRYHR